jgi:hypothetical protein
MPTIRRYGSIDQRRTSELIKKSESLLAALRELSGFNGYSLIDSGNGVLDLRRLLRHGGAGRRVDPRRRQLAARTKARDGTPQPAEDHERHRRPQDARARPGLTASRLAMAQRWPAHAGLLRACGRRDERNASELSAPMGVREEPLMAQRPEPIRRARTVGHVSHDAGVRVDQRVREILDRREAALE